MAAAEIGYLGAAGAGLLSFLSPCVLPLAPAYLCFLGGVSMDQLAGTETTKPAQARRVLWAAAAFVLGFGTVFVAFGASASALSALILQNKLWLGRIAGVVIVLFGLHYMGLFRIGLLYREARFHPRERPATLAGAFVVGLAFAFGWTPCIGPVLATVLTVAAQRDSLGYGASLLAAYAAGLGVPFILAALAAGPFLRWMARMRRHIRKVEIATGALLVATGLLFVFGEFERLAYWLLDAFPALGALG